MRSIVTLLLSILLMTVAAPAEAVHSDSRAASLSGALTAPEGPGLAVNQDSGLTLDQAVEQVRRQYNGRIVSAETKVSGGRETHIIKVLTSDGKVKTVRVPGRRL